MQKPRKRSRDMPGASAYSRHVRGARYTLIAVFARRPLDGRAVVERLSRVVLRRSRLRATPTPDFSGQDLVMTSSPSKAGLLSQSACASLCTWTRPLTASDTAQSKAPPTKHSTPHKPHARADILICRAPRHLRSPWTMWGGREGPHNADNCQAISSVSSVIVPSAIALSASPPMSPRPMTTVILGIQSLRSVLASANVVTVAV